MAPFSSPEVQQWLDDYARTHAALLEDDPEFRSWLEEEYVPIGGAWQY